MGISWRHVEATVAKAFSDDVEGQVHELQGRCIVMPEILKSKIFQLG
jgi:hypothetical protein